MKEKLTFMKKRPFVFGAVVIVLIVVLALILKGKNNGTETIAIKVGDFVNEVSVSGKVIASEDVNLGFKNSGRINQVYFSVDKLVGERQVLKAGTLIAKLDAQDAEKNVHDAEIGLENAKLLLAKFKLNNSKENLDADLQKAYDNGFVEVSDTFLDLSPTITGLYDILNETNLSDNAARNSGTTAQNYRNEAEKLYYKVKNLFEESRINFRSLNRDSSKADIKKIINETYDITKILIDAIKSTKSLVDYMSEDTGQTSNFTSAQSTLYEYTNTINGHFSNLLSFKTSIKNSEDVFSSSDLDIQSLELTVKQKENILEDAKNKLADYYIRAPFDGIITKIDAKIGEIASPNTPLISMMSAGTFQIESFVPEVNIAKIKLDDEAKVTLDAYGEDVLFFAKVVSIDPAETIRDGVSTYKVKLQFEEKDERIKSGMTANVSVVVFKKAGVITVPEGVIYEENGKSFVQVKNEKDITEREVVIGLKSSLGQVEIVSGLSSGEEIILKPNIN